MYIPITIISLVLYSCSGAFVDELQTFESGECDGEDKFQCYSGACILQDQYCDGRQDCDDGTDENYCEGRLPDADLCNATHQFLCEDRGHCIPLRQICDGDPDCNDGSDEINCTDDFNIVDGAICNGFQCSNGVGCISKLRVCDGRYDCEDRSDEYREDMCRHARLEHSILDGTFCQENKPGSGERSYQCVDSSFCLPARMMCDGMKDCRDGSDEGDFCKNWHTMCSSHKFPGNDTACHPDRSGPTCHCLPLETTHQFNNITQKCEDVDECLLERPHCSHRCINADGHFACECDEGYVKDQFGYLCYANGPEAMLFFSTRNEIKFLKVKSKVVVTVATGIRQAHGVSYDGQYLYWVETAQGHQSIVRAHLENIEEKQILAGFGLEDPGDISIDWLGRNIYLSDALRGTISACTLHGEHCATLPAYTSRPKFVTVDPRKGKMYWADHHESSVIMSARMDGTQFEILVDHLETRVTGLALDAPNERLYFVDRTVKVLMLSTRKVYSLFEEPFHRPYSIQVFENTVFWSDWTSMTIQTADKLHGTHQKRNLLLTLNTPVFGMHIYHAALMPTSLNPCSYNHCSHLCYVTSNSSHACGCPDGMHLRGIECVHLENHRSKYVVIAEGQTFTRLEYNTIGNPEGHATNFDIGRVQAMAYDNTRDTLFLYDGQRRSINYINMSDFTLGVTHALIYHGLQNVVDMDYDYSTDNLYILDAGRGLIEVMSVRTLGRAVVYNFDDFETPISFCVVPNHGIMLVAILGNEQHNNIMIDSIKLDGSLRTHVAVNNFKGPHVQLRYAEYMDTVFISDEGNGVIDLMHPGGSGRENFRELYTTVTSLALTDSYVFWTDRRTPRLFWSNIHESTHAVRRISLSIFPNDTRLHIQATTGPPHVTNPLLSHPCLKTSPCSEVCVQSTSPTGQTGFQCLCPPGYYPNKDGACAKLTICEGGQFYCRFTNKCLDMKKFCDGNKDCAYGEDETNCKALLSPIGKSFGVFLSWAKLHVWQRRFPSGQAISNTDLSALSPSLPSNTTCDAEEFHCIMSDICLPRTLMCDSRADCPDGSDEFSCSMPHCDDTFDFRCASGSCIPKTWQCDNDKDCGDGTDEVDCEGRLCKPHQYQCRDRECIDEKLRCDGARDCGDFSDEEDCEETDLIPVEESLLPNCGEFEFGCSLNASICLPLTARCNMQVDCPGATDEINCDYRCAPHGKFACKQQLLCIPMKDVCDGTKHCIDGTDETPDACYIVNKTSHLYPPMLRPSEECQAGYLCDNGQCVERHQLCDHHQDCADGTDEGNQCLVTCPEDFCSQQCYPTPRGPHCACVDGYTLDANNRSCVDVDECAAEPCSQQCINIPGSFICACHHGYSLRHNRRSCKATHGNMAILYVSGNTVRSRNAYNKDTVEFSDTSVAAVSAADYNVRKQKLYLTSAEQGKLVEVNSTHDVVTLTNIGRPTRVAVDWVTGNVYFVDSSPGAARMRVCSVRRKRCAVLQKLPSHAVVSSLIVDPKSRLMFYCVTSGTESVVWSASLSGHGAKDLAFVTNCTGLAVDSFMKRLYVAESGPSRIIRMSYSGEELKIISADPKLQSPHGLSIFEDHIYYFAGDSSRLNRCRLYGAKDCEIFMHLFNTSTFVLVHESVQRDDVKDECEGVKCPNVCVVDQDGAKCICEDGSFTAGGLCKLGRKEDLPLFNGWSYQDYKRAHQTSFTIISIVFALLVIYLGLFVYYHFVYKPRRNRASQYTEVRYQNNAAGTTLTYAPNLDMASDGGVSHEFVNPLQQYVRNILRQSRRGSPKPIGTAGLNIEGLQSPQDLSDTESQGDLDDTEKLIQSSFRRK